MCCSETVILLLIPCAYHYDCTSWCLVPPWSEYLSLFDHVMWMRYISLWVHPMVLWVHPMVLFYPMVFFNPMVLFYPMVLFNHQLEAKGREEEVMQLIDKLPALYFGPIAASDAISLGSTLAG